MYVMSSIKCKNYQICKEAQNVTWSQEKNQPIETHLETTEMIVFRQ